MDTNKENTLSNQLPSQPIKGSPKRKGDLVDTVIHKAPRPISPSENTASLTSTVSSGSSNSNVLAILDKQVAVVDPQPSQYANNEQIISELFQRDPMSIFHLFHFAAGNNNQDYASFKYMAMYIALSESNKKSEIAELLPKLTKNLRTGDKKYLDRIFSEIHKGTSNIVFQQSLNNFFASAAYYYLSEVHGLHPQEKSLLLSEDTFLLIKSIGDRYGPYSDPIHVDGSEKSKLFRTYYLKNSSTTVSTGIFSTKNINVITRGEVSDSKLMARTHVKTLEEKESELRTALVKRQEQTLQQLHEISTVFTTITHSISRHTEHSTATQTQALVELKNQLSGVKDLADQLDFNGDEDEFDGIKKEIGKQIGVASGCTKKAIESVGNLVNDTKMILSGEMSIQDQGMFRKGLPSSSASDIDEMVEVNQSL